ncbi:MAG: OB-fold putative lipoprotein [Proteobacteria bacterium]|nr:OB-fold putative lipoprotein [Cystobacterineae bacterium]MCL2258679.1 OB-fold putative lipoprotein [Cystobacterineae bacterium]MCL2314931.1 OB-fold putative lipoprotein [Pseudomonadota bacterium]
MSEAKKTSPWVYILAALGLLFVLGIGSCIACFGVGAVGVASVAGVGAEIRENFKTQESKTKAEQETTRPSLNEQGVRLLKLTISAAAKKAIGEAKVNDESIENAALSMAGLSAVILAPNYSFEYESNEISADQMFKGRMILVSGVVEEINKDIMGAGYLVLKGHKNFSRVRASLKTSSLSRAAVAKKGSKVHMVCKGKGMMLSISMLDECQFADEYSAIAVSQAENAISEFLSGNVPVVKPLGEMLIEIYAMGAELPQDSSCFDDPFGNLCTKAKREFKKDAAASLRAEKVADELRGVVKLKELDEPKT